MVSGAAAFQGLTNACQVCCSMSFMGLLDLQCGQRVRTKRCAMMPKMVAEVKNGATPKSCSLVNELGASLVCKVDNTKCPVSEACTAISAVSVSRISPIMMISGSWRINERIPSAKVKSILFWICIWLNDGSTISMGSSMVQTLTSSVASFLRVLYSVVVLPEPVGPVTKIIPLALRVMSSHFCKSRPVSPNCSKERTSTSGSNTRITNFSPNAVGSVDNRSSVSWPLGVRVLSRPSCGLRFSATLSLAKIFIRATTAVIIPVGIW